MKSAMKLCRGMEKILERDHELLIIEPDCKMFWLFKQLPYSVTMAALSFVYYFS
jgi:hypothetical protein